MPDLIKPGLRVLFCGINPGRMSGALGQHFARPGNRFWKVLHLAGFTERILAPSEQWSLLERGLGITNLVPTTSRAAADLTTAQLRAGALELEAKVARWRPAFVAVLGMQAYRMAFRRPRATIGEQPDPLAGARLWLLPNPSGLQARYGLPDMVDMFAALRRAAGPVEGVDANASKTHLLDVAKRLDIRGRTHMSKDELVEAILKADRRQADRARP